MTAARRCVACADAKLERVGVATVHDSRGCLDYCVEHAVKRLTTTSLMFGGVCACEREKDRRSS